MERLSDWFLKRLKRANNLADGAALLRQAGERIGLPRPAATGDVDEDDPQHYCGKPLALLLGWPGDWVNAFRADGLDRYVPFALHCRFEHRPFTWRAGDEGTSLNDSLLNGLPRQAMRALSAHVNAGITIPVYRAGGRIGHITFAHPDPATDVDAIQAELGPELFLIAHQFIEALDSWGGKEPAESAPQPLTAREMECLRWVSMGNTDEEVSRIIFRSPATTRFHIKNAIRKLGAANRAHAISLAYQRQLLPVRV